jgi:hypothetical protein
MLNVKIAMPAFLLTAFTMLTALLLAQLDTTQAPAFALFVPLDVEIVLTVVIA